MLNPSTADADVLDPTLRRCRGFAHRAGYSGMVIANVFAYRATDPSELEDVGDPVGPENLQWVVRAAVEASQVVVGWGANRLANGHRSEPRAASNLADHLLSLKIPLYCLGVTKDGSPRHPLYVRSDQRIQVWREP